MSKEQTFKAPKISIQVLSDTVFLIHGLRLSYPNLWVPGKDFEDPSKLKTSLDASHIIPRSELPIIKTIMSKFIKAARTLDNKIKNLKQTKNPKFIKPDDEDYYVLKTTNSFKYPPRYIDCHGKVLTDPLAAGADSVLYAGCYTTIKVEINPETLKTGKHKVWCNLIGIQFLADGEPFGKAMTNDEAIEGFGQVDSGIKKSKSSKSKTKKVKDDLDEEFEDDLDEEFENDLEDDLDDELDDKEEFDEDEFDL